MSVIGSDIQIEDGDFTRLHNRIFEVLAQARFTASEFRIIAFLLRKTYGYGKKEDDLSLSQWEEGTNTDRTQISRTLADLIEKNVIYRLDSTRRYCHRYGFNKYIENWDQSLFVRNESRQTRNLDPEVKENLDPEVKEVSNLDPEVKENLDPEVKEVSNLDPEVKEILTQRSNNKRKHTKENNTTPSSTKTRKRAVAQEDPEAQDWFSALCWLVHRHKDYHLLSKEDRLAIATTAKQIRASPSHYTIDDLRAWYRDIWSKEWPGKQRDKEDIQPPTLKQIKTGIGRVKPNTDSAFQPSDTVSAQVDFALEEIAL